jgi:hypothetical protein
MNIESALEETGKAILSDYENLYARKDFHNDAVYWFDRFGDVRREPIGLSNINNAGWRPYYKEREIRPDNEGELWEKSGALLFTICDSVNGLRTIGITGYISKVDKEIIHGKNGWKRTRPPVEDEDENVETIVIEQAHLFDGIQNYLACNVETMDYIVENLLCKDGDTPYMKVILKIPKEQ